MRKEDFPNAQYHPDFLSCSSASRVNVVVTLISREKMLFCVSESVLRASSGVFDTILSLPQPMGDTPSDPFIDNLDEDATTLEGLLRMITGRELPPLDTIEAIEPLVLAAYKWEMPGPLSILKMTIIMDTTFAQNHPIRLYSLGCRLKWTALVNLGANYSCNDDIYYSQGSSVLDTMDSHDLLRLLIFHRRRRDCMRAYFDGSAWAKTVCIYSPQYQNLRDMVLDFMDSNSPGKPLEEAPMRNVVVQSRLETHLPMTCVFHERVGVKHPELLSSNATDDFLVPKLLEQWKFLPKDILGESLSDGQISLIKISFYVEDDSVPRYEF